MTENNPPEAPAPGTKADLEQQLAAARAENVALTARLEAAGGQRGTAPVQHKFTLTEGDRQELGLYGVATIGGRLMTREEAQEAAEQAGQPVEIDEPSAELDRRPGLVRQLGERGQGVRGFDYVYPSVAPGKIDPAVAGTPGVHGPAASAADLKAGK